MIMPFRKKRPQIHDKAFVAPGAHVIGEVSVASGASVWFGAVLRGDMGKIVVGENSNVQDGSVLHGDHNVACVVERGVTIGHQATVHACHIEEGCLIGIGARVLSGARVGAYSLVGAGAVVLENAKIPSGSLVLGMPGKVVRKLTALEIKKLKLQSKRYSSYAKEYKKYLG